MQNLVNILISWILKFLPENGKTFLAAAIAALLAANAALQTGGIVFLPEQIVTVLGWVAVALGLVGLRHGQMKLEASLPATAQRGGNSGNRFLGLLLLIGSLSLFSGCAFTWKSETEVIPVKKCHCCVLCKCGTDCSCVPGNKCAVGCDCKKGGVKPTCPFDLTKLPTAPPDMYNVLNDGFRNGWWGIKGTNHLYGWFYEDRFVGLYNIINGEWIEDGCTKTAPWLRKNLAKELYSGVSTENLTVGDKDRLLTGGGK